MANELRTFFIFESDKGDKAISQTHKNLHALNTEFNNLGKNLSVGKTISEDFTKAGRAADSFQNKVKDTFKSYGDEAVKSAQAEKAIEQAKRATLQTQAEEIKLERQQIALKRDQLELEQQISGLKSKPDPGLKNAANDLGKRSDDLRKSFQSIASQRLDNGQVNNLTKEIVFASENARRLDVNIKRIKAEIAKPNKNSSIESLTKELRTAEKEAVMLEKKLGTLNRTGGAGSGGRLGGANNLRLSSFQKTNLSYQVNDVLTGLASGQNPTQILAQQGGQIAQIFDPKQITAFAAAYGGLVTILGAGAVAIAATWKITGDIRKEAEQRLKYEEMIVGAINRQNLAQKASIENFKEMRKQAEFDRRFAGTLETNDVDALRRQRASIEQLQNLTPSTTPVLVNGKTEQKANDTYERQSAQILALDKQIEAAQQNSFKRANDSFNKQFENRVKSQAQALEFERKQEEKRIEAEKKRLEQIEKGKEKVKELQKQYSSVFDGLFQKTGANNPFVSVFSEADKSLKALRENLRGLSPELQTQAIALQNKINSNALFETKLDNQLEVFDLRSRAANFRNSRNPEAAKQSRDAFVQDQINRGNRFQFGGTYGSNLSNQAGGFDKLADTQKRDIYETSLLGNFQNLPKDAFYNANQNGLIGALATDRLRGTGENQSVNDRLQSQVKILDSFSSTDEQKAIADRRLVSLTAGMNPNDLNPQLREKVATANERVADRREKYEQEALKIEQQKLEVQRQIAENGKKLIEIAEKQGLKGIENVIRIIDETNGGVSVDKAPVDKAANQDDVDAQYGGNLNFSGSGGFSNR